MRVIAGRDFRIDETRAAGNITLVNESFARRHFGGPLGALGQRVGPTEFAVIALLLASAGLTACFRPARRVLTADAIHAIRAE